MTQFTSALKTILLVFFATIIGLLLTNGAGVLEMTHWSDWKPYAAAGIAAVLAFAYNYLNPWDQRYGMKKPE